MADGRNPFPLESARESQKSRHRLEIEKQGWIHGTRCALYASENNGGRTEGRTDGRTDTTSYRDATAHLKSEGIDIERQRDRERPWEQLSKKDVE